MKILLEINDDKVGFIVELLKHFNFVKVSLLNSDKSDAIEGFRQSVEEVKLHREGKIKLKPAKDLLNEI